MIVTSLPIWAVDLVGSMLMIVFSFLCLRLSFKLKKTDPQNLIFTYLFWVCSGLALFAVSRSIGHILKQVLFMTANDELWRRLQPYSGAINSFTLTVLGAITLFFERVWKIYQSILKDKHAIVKAHENLLYLNQNLENMVADRTEALALSEKKYRRIFEVSRDMILVARKDGGIVDLNPVGHKMIGYESAEHDVTGRCFRDFMENPSDWDSIIDIVEKQGFVASAEYHLKRKDRSVLPTLISGSVDKGAWGKEDALLFLIKDIEKRRMMEKQMIQTDKLVSIGQFSAGVAHEINNPLGIILGYTQLLCRGETPNTQRYEDLKTIEKHVRNCKGIVEDLLNFARSSKPEKEWIDFNRALEEVVAFVRHHSNIEKIEIEKSFEQNLPMLWLDEKKIKQVFINLIMNAIHAIKDAGKIILSTRLAAEGKQVILCVEDNGYGIDPKNIDRIFDPFFTTKPTGEGTGLGLSVSYGIIKNHGGEILVDSEKNRGATFTVILPVLEKDIKENYDAATFDSRRR